jgi:hypothetical protein
MRGIPAMSAAISMHWECNAKTQRRKAGKANELTVLTVTEW